MAITALPENDVKDADWSSDVESDDYDDGTYETEIYPSGWTQQRVVFMLIVLVVLALLLVFVIFPALHTSGTTPELPPLQPPVQV